MIKLAGLEIPIIHPIFFIFLSYFFEFGLFVCNKYFPVYFMVGWDHIVVGRLISKVFIITYVVAKFV